MPRSNRRNLRRRLWWQGGLLITGLLVLLVLARDPLLADATAGDATGNALAQTLYNLFLAFCILMGVLFLGTVSTAVVAASRTK